MNLLGYNSPLISLLTKISQLFMINILWILCSVPIFTVGASTAALYSVTMAMAEKRGGNVFVSFFRAFKQNFRDGVAVFLLMSGIFTVLAADLYVIMTYEFPGWPLAVGLLGLLTVLFLMVWSLVFPLTAKYHNSPGGLIRSALILTLQYFYRVLFMTVMNVLPLIAYLMSPSVFLELSIYWVLIGFAVTAYLNSIIVLQIFRKNDSNCEVEH